MKKIIFTLTLILLSTIGFAQETYYKMPNGKIINLATYDKVKENLSKNGKVEENFIKIEKRYDSIIKSVKLTVIDEKSDHFDPFAEFRKKTGQHFPIENFKNRDGKNFSSEELKGKPTFINLWFTNCPPCIKEIPILNQLKENFKDKINFIAITFDNKEKVDEFLKKKNIDFKHITNSSKELNDLNIQAYPMNLILDNEGKIEYVYGEILYEETEINEILKQLL